MDKIFEKILNETLSFPRAFSLNEKEVPDGGETEIVIAIVIGVVVDVQTIGVEIADIDAVAVRVENLPIFV